MQRVPFNLASQDCGDNSQLSGDDNCDWYEQFWIANLEG